LILGWAGVIPPCRDPSRQGIVFSKLKKRKLLGWQGGGPAGLIVYRPSPRMREGILFRRETNLHTKQKTKTHGPRTEKKTKHTLLYKSKKRFRGLLRGRSSQKGLRVSAGLGE